jgi:3-dehydrotetronate 4-kinase
MLIGCVADDLTGATDLALMLSRGGMRTVQTVGVPDPGKLLPDADAIVVALKSRTIPAAEAVEQSLLSAEALRRAGARQLFFKYCSTFDSTDAGNIGPVTEALMQRLDAPLTLACPAFPTNGRTVYQGHLFVGATLLSDSPMRDHPLTPMRDSNLVRVLQRQTKLKVGLVPVTVVDRGSAAIAEAFAAARRDGTRIVIVDAVTDRHLREIGAAAKDLALVTGGSGVALGLPENFLHSGLASGEAASGRLAAPVGRAAILAGSCSAATRGQVEAAITAGLPARRIDPLALASGSDSAAAVLSWIDLQSSERPVLVYSSADPAQVGAAQEKLGRDRAASLVETAMAELAKGLAARGATRLIVAGGETSGAVVDALGIRTLAIGPEIDPGVPWTLRLDGKPMALALKSGNFGAPDFFLKAWSLLV